MCVLVVDDEKLAAEHAEILLDEAGIKSDICFSGEEAIKMLELRHAKHDPYNLVLLDWKMPKWTVLRSRVRSANALTRKQR